MKLRNAIVALGLVIALTIGMNTTVNAHVFQPLQVEQVNGVIEELRMERNSVSMQVTCESGSQLSVYSMSGQLLHQSPVSSGNVEISTTSWGLGSFVIVLTESNEQTLKIVVKN
jgi:hypothetical protein